jgi:cellulose synthase/poly-beta-1,6-N-acetylglucosamine synthase-like glycosyltransferase
VLNWIFYLITVTYFLILLSFFIGLFFPNKQQSTKKYRVSVVVAARNEEQNIRTLLSELLQQTYPSSKYEIILVNDESEDGTGEIIDEFVNKYDNVKHIHAISDRETGLTAKKNALNQGIRQSTGELILSTDADCHVKPTWIETMVSYFTDDVGMVIGFSQLGDKQYPYSFFERVQAVDFLSLMAAAQGSSNLNFPLAVSGQNIAYRKAAFEAVGGFEKIKHRISGDDVLLLQLMRKYTNWKIRFAPSERAFNWTQPEKTIKSFLNQRKRWASNGSYQTRLNKIFFFFIVSVFITNLILLFGTPVYYLLYDTIKIPFICLLAKIIVEFSIILKGSLVYQRKDLVKYFPIWAVLQIPYVIFTGLMGSLGCFIWKDRKYFQEVTIFRTDQ